MCYWRNCNDCNILKRRLAPLQWLSNDCNLLKRRLVPPMIKRRLVPPMIKAVDQISLRSFSKYNGVQDANVKSKKQYTWKYDKVNKGQEIMDWVYQILGV